MSTDLIQVDYEALVLIAQRFSARADANQELGTRVRQAMDNLAQGGWEGRGADAFHAEMSGEVMPAFDRLTSALVESQSVTRQIAEILREAEEEAASLFGGNGRGVGPSLGVGIPGNTPLPDVPGGSPPAGPIPIPYPNADRGSSRGGGSSSIWDHLRPKGTGFEFDFGKTDGKRRGRNFDPGIKLTVGTEESSVWGNPKGDDIAAVGGYVEGGFKASMKEGVLVGAGGEYYTVKGDWDTALVGDKEYGVTGGVGFKALSADAFGGIQFDRKNQQIGATAGVNLVSVEGSVGGNVAGYNVSATGEVGIKAELGFKLGRKGVEVKLPFVSLGLKFGGGVD